MSGGFCRDRQGGCVEWWSVADVDIVHQGILGPAGVISNATSEVTVVTTSNQ